MKPTFKSFAVQKYFFAFLCAMQIVFPLAAFSQSSKQPPKKVVQSQTDKGGDTLDTSTPAPAGMTNGELNTNGGSMDAPAQNSSPKGVIEAEGLEPAPQIGGFIIPLTGDVFYDSDLRILVVLPPISIASMVLLVDGYPDTNPLSIKEGLVSAQLNRLKAGVHELSLIMFNEKTEIIAKEETRFFIRLPEPIKKNRNGEFKQFGRVVAKIDWKNGEAKGRILSQSALLVKPASGDSLLQAGTPETPVSQELDGATEAAYNVKYKQFEAYGKVLLRTDENRFRQPAHRLTTTLKYGPWAAIKAGDIYPLYNGLVLNGTRVRGAEAVARIVTGEKQWGSLRVVKGESRRAVPAYLVKYDTGNGTRVDTVSGTYAQTLTAARLGFGGGSHFDMGITLLKSTDTRSSPDDSIISNLIRGQKPAENVVPGLDLRVGMWDGRIQFYGNSALSLYTRDRSLGAFHLDTFNVVVDPQKISNLFIFNSTTRGWQYLLSKNGAGQGPDVTGFLKSTSAYESGAVASIPLPGVITETEIRYSHLGLDYHSEGNPFLGGNPGDGFTLLQKLIVLDNQLSLGMELGNYKQDLGVARQVQRNFKVEMRFTPGPYQPSFWVGGGRSNIAPEGVYAHQFSSSFLNFNSGGYHQFQLANGKLHTTLLYGYTQSDLTLMSVLPGDVLPVFPTTRTNIVNAMLQYKMRNLDFLPRLSYSFSHNGIQLPTHSVTMGFIEPFAQNTVKLDLSTTVGQYPESNDKNDVTLGAAANVQYVLGPQQTFNVREKWIQYGNKRNLLVGANYEMFF